VSVTTIGGGAFAELTNLTSITIPACLTSIGDDAFRCCASLTSVTLPASLASIGENAFNNCTSLTNVLIPPGVTNIGQYAFEYCPKLPASVRDSIRARPSQTPPTFRSESLTLGDYTYTTNASGQVTITEYNGSVRAAVIPDSINGLPVTSIGPWAFSGCTSLTNVVIPPGVTNIGLNAFKGCPNLPASIRVRASTRP
jgi:hypothetical protein